MSAMTSNGMWVPHCESRKSYHLHPTTCSAGGLPTPPASSFGDSFISPLRKINRNFSERASYIPDQADPLGAAVTEAVRLGPFTLAFRDLWTCVKMFGLFPGVINPIFTTNPQHEFYPWGPNLLGLFLLTIASVLEVVVLLAVIPMFLILPGPVSICIFILGQLAIHAVCWPMQGPSRVYSKPPTDPRRIAMHQQFSNERWFFLNGCCVSGHNVQMNVDVLSETFGRPVFGIHNRTYGVLGDLFECIMQRAFDLFTEETRVCYEYMKAYCTDPKVTKVMMIAHSHGCIMASQILDQLYVDLPTDAVKKLEVYTFGNAASHFNNPLRHLSTESTSIDSRDMHDAGDSASVISAPDNKASHMTSLDNSSPSQKKPTISEYLPERVIPHIEHYCNSGDMVTRWGALFSAKSILSNRFCGHIFINEGASGHMLNQHYLSEMFPTTTPHQHPQAGTHYGRRHLDYTEVPFLDRVVHLDTATITQRDQNAVHQLAVMRHESSEQAIDDHTHTAGRASVHSMHSHQTKGEFDSLKLGEGTRLTAQDLSGAEGSRISVVKVHDPLEEYRGKTVRQLSRLWRYLDGGDPDMKS
jgi:hypothetical protein